VRTTIEAYQLSQTYDHGTGDTDGSISTSQQHLLQRRIRFGRKDIVHTLGGVLLTDRHRSTEVLHTILLTEGNFDSVHDADRVAVYAFLDKKRSMEKRETTLSIGIKRMSSECQSTL